MHSGGFELMKLTFTRLEYNLIRHRGDRLPYKMPGRTSASVSFRVQTDQRHSVDHGTSYTGVRGGVADLYP